eukprot:TRINITY_DN66857_c0_g2_i1.p2 TRINITY_DN66857_c0_g2~~TRINITY_DN66857_c0_g2_i1.p2  ORF type:complete len:607 (+),score=78.15 TRINITY_DN66857_c0_g2_i1:2224-4044(+)
MRFNQEIVLRGEPTASAAIERDRGIPSFPQIDSKEFSVSDDNMEVTFNVPIDVEQKVSLIIPRAFICSKEDDTLCWDPSDDPNISNLRGLLVFLTEGSTRDKTDLTMTMASSFLNFRFNPCARFDLDEYRRLFELALEDAFALDVTVICTSCEEDCNLALITKKKKFQTQAQADFTIFVVFVVNDIALEAAQTLATMMNDALGSGAVDPVLSARGLGPTIEGTVHLANGVVELPFLDVTNSPDNNGVATVAEIHLQLNPDATARGLVKDGKIQVLFPHDWVLDPEIENWKVAVESPIFGTVTFKNGEFLVDNQLLTIDMTFNNYINDIDSRRVGIDPNALTVLITVLEGATMPPKCNGINAWIWAVLFLDRDDTVTQFKLENAASDTCNDQSVFLFGDPHFVSFSGGEYDVTGKAGFTYNIITDKYFQWNAQFVSRNARSSMFTYIGRTGFSVNGTRVVCDPATKTVTIGRHDVTPQEYDTRLYIAGNGVNNVNMGGVERSGAVSYYIKVTKDLVFLRVPGFRIVLKYMSQDHGKPLAHFDHFVELADDPMGRISPHGLLGQTANFLRPVTPKGKNGQGVIEGTVDDYEVPALFSTKFKFNKHILQ